MKSSVYAHQTDNQESPPGIAVPRPGPLRQPGRPQADAPRAARSRDETETVRQAAGRREVGGAARGQAGRRRRGETARAA
ncbi:hypothetical protein BGLA2_420156 [Burkholderia gladioli]|nr:hypothetical protein BGLA2_420156 [Burkholderia gladioli]